MAAPNPDEVSLTQRIQSFMREKSPERRESAAVDALFHEIMPEFYRVAARELGRRDSYFAPLSKTELISELWVQHLAKGRWVIEDRRHFFALAGKVMRHVIVDCARKRCTQKRGSGELAVPLEESALQRASIHDDRQAVEI
jgi:DNA-directed RNA polymerase specialized sigma24 family protein